MLAALPLALDRFVAPFRGALFPDRPVPDAKVVLDGVEVAALDRARLGICSGVWGFFCFFLLQKTK